MFLSIPSADAEGLRILEVNSYSSDWVWVQDQSRAFREAFNDDDVEYRVIDLDAKNLTEEGILKQIGIAESTISTWNPDLIYLTDDRAQKDVAVPHLETGIPMVFSGVNQDISGYGYENVENVTGVLEIEHFMATARLMMEILQKESLEIAIVLDDDPTWLGVEQRLRKIDAETGSIKITRWIRPGDYVSFQEEILAVQGEVDALGMLGVIRFPDEEGEMVNYEDVLKWTAEHSTVPDFAFWSTRVARGTLCAVTVSGREQGRIAGEMARRILIEGITPGGIAPRASQTGEPALSLRRARELEIPVHTKFLLNSHVYPTYTWD